MLYTIFNRKQAALLANVFSKRLYPELEEYRSRYGFLKEFPPMVEEDLQAYEYRTGSVQDAVECSRCCFLQAQLDEISRQLQHKVDQIASRSHRTCISLEKNT